MPFLLIARLENVALPVDVSKLTRDVDEDSEPFELHFDRLAIEIEAFHV